MSLELFFMSGFIIPSNIINDPLLHQRQCTSYNTHIIIYYIGAYYYYCYTIHAPVIPTLITRSK